MQVCSWMPSLLGCIFTVFHCIFWTLDVSPCGLLVAWCCRFFGAPVSDTGAGGADTTSDSRVGPGRSVVWTYTLRLRQSASETTTTTTTTGCLSQACPPVLCDGPWLAARDRSCSASERATTACCLAARAAVDRPGPGHVYAPLLKRTEVDGQGRGSRGAS